MYRTGWSSVERITSGSLRLSRASTRTSLASDDLEKYMNGSGANGGSLNKIPTNDDLMATLGASTSAGAMAIAIVGGAKPLPPPRVSSSGSTGNTRILSASGRNQEFLAGGGALSVDAATTAQQQVSHSSSSSIPPPVKPRKSSSISGLNHQGNQSEANQSSNFFTNHNLSENSKIN